MNSRLDTQAVPSLARGGGSGDSREPRLPPLQPHFLGFFPPGSAELSPKSRFESMIFPKGCLGEQGEDSNGSRCALENVGGFWFFFCVGFAPKNLEPRLFHEAEMEHSQK